MTERQHSEHRWHWAVIRFAALACVVVGVGGGCASSQMKGTPFYTGEYTVRQGPVEDRVNLWPLLYYREPALSALWPIMEMTDDHFAIRPLMSIYDRQTDDPIYNVLWPLARFDTRHDRHRIFPLFWGDEYFVGFPLYWRFDDPFGDGGYDGLLPLWSYRSRGQGRHSTHVLWPFLHHKRWADNNTGWRIWPLAGSYNTRGDRYRFAAWPLGHQWSNRDRTSNGSCFVPLYYRHRNADNSLFLSLPYSRGESGERSWETVLPLYYRSRDANRSLFMSLPYSRGENQTRSWETVLPLYYRSRSARKSLFLSLPYSRSAGDEQSWEAVLPLYYRRKSETSKGFYSLLYCSGEDESKEEKWNLTVPLWYSKTSPEERLVATLAGGYWREGEEKRWMAVPLLAGGASSEDSGDVWVGGPLAHAGWDGEYGSHHVFPFYYRSRREQGKRFYSLLWSSGEDRDGSNWQLLMPFMYRHRDDSSRTLITPLYAQGTADGGENRWKSIVPFLFNRKTQDDHLVATLLGGFRRREDSLTWLAYPLLAGGKVTDTGGSFWAAAPLVHAHWDAEKSSHHVLPLYYWNGWSRTFISPPVARWRRGDATTTLIPPAISWLRQREHSSDLWMLGPLAHFSWGEEAAASHIFPLYYRNRRTAAFVSPVAARWRHGDARTTVVPPTLSWLTQRENRSDLWMLGPLAHLSWGDEATTSHIFPLYYRNRETETLVSPFVASWNTHGTRYRLAPPLLSLYSRDGETKNLYAALGLYRQQWGENVVREGHLVPFYTYREDDYLLTPLAGYKRDAYMYPFTPLIGAYRGDRSGGWVFPLWSHKKDLTSGYMDGTFLWGRYWRYANDSGSGIFPLYGYKNFGSVPEDALEGKHPFSRYGKRFWSLPACWYRNETTVRRKRKPQGTEPMSDERRRKEHGFFPLWRYSRTELETLNREEVDGALLLLLYDYQRKVRKADEKREGDDYTRARVLWRLWHYERANGNVSVDVFPAITYDKKTDGFKKLSFLWRCFRYESGPKGKKLDLLFVPIVRKDAP